MIEEQNIPVLLDGVQFESLSLTPEDFFVLSRINGVLTVKEISQMVGFPLDKTTACMQKFVENKVIQFKSKDEKKKKPVSDHPTIGQELDVEDQDPILSLIPRTFRNRIQLLSSDLDKKNFFEILEVSPSADGEEIHKSYLKLVKEFHPDSLRGKDAGHYKQKMEKLFDKIQEAYQEIHPDGKRATYLHSLVEGRRTTKKVEEKKSGYEYKKPVKTELKFADADTQFEMGRKEEKKGNLQAAMNFYQMAMNLNPQRKAYEEAFFRVRKLMREGF